MVTSFHFFSTALDVFCHLGSGLNPQALFHPETGGSEQVYSFCDQMIILCSKYQVQLDCQTCCMWNVPVQGHTLAIKAQQEPVCQISKQAQRTFRPHQNPVRPAFPHARRLRRLSPRCWILPRSQQWLQHYCDSSAFYFRTLPDGMLRYFFMLLVVALFTAILLPPPHTHQKINKEN